MLQINQNKLWNAFFEQLKIELTDILETNWKGDIDKFNGAIPSFVNNPKADFEIYRTVDKLIVYLKANPQMLAVSYGTGTMMDTSNPGLDSYKSSSLWNPARTSKKIVGRPEGDYYDFMIGEKKHTSGRFKGKILSNNKGFPKELHPTNAIKDANNFLYKVYIDRAIKNTISKINLSKFLEEV